MFARLIVPALLVAACVACTSAPPPEIINAPLPSSSTAASPPASSSAASSSAAMALAVLDALPVKGRAPMTGYSRDQFGQAWTDDNDDEFGHNGCDTRNDILKRDLTDVVFRSGSHCVVASGVLHDPYTGKVIHFVRGEKTSPAVQIDHVVALGDAWQKGAQQLTAALRIDLANDPRELLAVDGPTNEAKGDGDAATWLPPNMSYRCTYVTTQIEVSAAYHLWVTAAEKAAMQRVLARC